MCLFSIERIKSECQLYVRTAPARMPLPPRPVIRIARPGCPGRRLVLAAPLSEETALQEYVQADRPAVRDSISTAHLLEVTCRCACESYPIQRPCAFLLRPRKERASRSRRGAIPPRARKPPVA